MARRRKEQDFPGAFMQIAGLLLLLVFFVPAARHLLMQLLMLFVIGAVVAVVGLIGWKIWRKRTHDVSASSASSQSFAEGQFLARAEIPHYAAPQWSLELLQRLEWKRFEDVVAAYFSLCGQRARTTRVGADGGVDIELLDSATGQVTSLVQCKAWRSYKVGVKPVRELFGVMAASGVKQGAFYTTSSFTGEARDFARLQNLDLVDGEGFLARMQQLSAADRSHLCALATAGDYTTPTCPRCGVKMVLRTASRGANEGTSFWGCPHYPRCKQTFQYSDS